MNIKKTILEVLEQFELQAITKEIVLSYYFQPNVPNVISQSKNEIMHALRILVANSLKHCHRGASIQAWASVTQNEEKELLQLHVTDNGPGIPQEMRPQIFKLFGTKKNVSGINNNGIGLGLSMA